MALTREFVYALPSGLNAVTVAELNGNLYVGTSDTVTPTSGVIEIVDRANPVSDSLYENTSGVDDPEFVTTFGGKLYVSQFRGAAPNNIYRVDAGTGIAVFATTTLQPWAVMFLPDGSFWVTSFTGTIERRSAAGAFLGNITGFSTLGGGEYSDGFVYIPDINADEIIKVNTTTLAVSQFPMTADSVGEDLAIANGRVYWTERSIPPNYSVWSCALDGSGQVQEYVNNDWEPLGITYIGGYLYVVDASATSDCNIYRFPVGGRKWWCGVAGWGG